MQRSNVWKIIICALLLLMVGAWLATSGKTPPLATVPALNPPVVSSSAPARILFVHSYHRGYPWSDGILEGFNRTLDLEPLHEPDLWGNNDFLLRVFYLDSKRQDDEASKQQATARALELIKNWEPDIVVASDDNAVKYLIVPMVKTSTLPVVFIGVNWDASDYALPSNQVTGMIEVQPVDQIIDTLRPYARGNKIGFLKGKDLSAVKEADAFEKFLGLTLQRRLVNNFAEWLVAYREMQQVCDMLLVGNSASIHGWDERQAKQLVATATRIPTGTWDAWMRDYALVTFSTVPAEQGTWAAEATRAILAGRSPAEIAIVKNQKAKIYRNMTIAKELGIVFPMAFIRRSWAVEQGHPE